MYRFSDRNGTTTATESSSPLKSRSSTLIYAVNSSADSKSSQEDIFRIQCYITQALNLIMVMKWTYRTFLLEMICRIYSRCLVIICWGIQHPIPVRNCFYSRLMIYLNLYQCVDFSTISSPTLNLVQCSYKNHIHYANGTVTICS